MCTTSESLSDMVTSVSDLGGHALLRSTALGLYAQEHVWA